MRVGLPRLDGRQKAAPARLVAGAATDPVLFTRCIVDPTTGLAAPPKKGSFSVLFSIEGPLARALLLNATTVLPIDISEPVAAKPGVWPNGGQR